MQTNKRRILFSLAVLAVGTMFAVFLMVVVTGFSFLISPEAGGPGVGVIPKTFDAESVPMATVFA